jgi:hypothetical protein
MQKVHGVGGDHHTYFKIYLFNMIMSWNLKPPPLSAEEETCVYFDNPKPTVTQLRNMFLKPKNGVSSNTKD